MPEKQGLLVLGGHPVEESWIANRVTVGRYGADFNVIQDAIDYCDAIGGVWTIEIYPYGTAAAWDEGDITPAGTSTITLRGMGADRVIISPTAAPVAAVIVAAHDLTIENLLVIAPDATRPALAVSANTTSILRSSIVGVGAGDAIVMTGGVVEAEDTLINADVDLSTVACRFEAVRCDINGPIDTAGALAHIINLLDTCLENHGIASAATGATIAEILDCTYVGLLANAGTGNWTVRDSDVGGVNFTSTGTLTLFGGDLGSITRATASVVWWKDSTTAVVLPSGTITDTMIQYAVNAVNAAGADLVEIRPGTYQEAVTLAAGIDLVGVNKGQCIIDIDHAVLVTMAAGCRIANLTLNVTGDGTGNGIGVECNDQACTIEATNINLVRTAANAYGISELTGSTVREVHIRNVRITSDTDTNELAINCDQAGKTFYIENCWLQGGDYAVYCNTASIFYTDHTHLEVNVIPPGGGNTIYCAAATMHFRNCTILKQITAWNLGTIRLKNCSYREINRSGTGNIVDESPVLVDAPWHIQKWSWQAALANSQVSVRGTPIDAGTGQVLLEVIDNVAGQEAVESGTEAAGALSNKVTPARTPRFLTQISVDSFDAHTTKFFGLRETLGNAVPAATEHHAGFIWNGANFQASSDDGVATQTTNLTTPTTGVLVQLEVIVFGGVTTVGWVEFYINGVLVATHSTRIPVNGLDWQHILATAGAGGGDAIDVTVRNGGLAECPA